MRRPYSSGLDHIGDVHLLERRRRRVPGRHPHPAGLELADHREDCRRVAPLTGARVLGEDRHRLLRRPRRVLLQRVGETGMTLQAAHRACVGHIGGFREAGGTVRPSQLGGLVRTAVRPTTPPPAGRRRSRNLPSALERGAAHEVGDRRRRARAARRGRAVLLRRRRVR